MPKGYHVVYTSSTPELAILENIVHADPSTLTDDYVFVPAEIPDDVALQVLDDDVFPDGWRSTSRYSECQQIGRDWYEDAPVGLIVPSAVVPMSKNILLNPGHPDMKKIEIKDPLPYRFDERLTD